MPSFKKMDEYTPTEKAHLLEFRQLVSDILITDDQKHDSFLIRWLRAINLDLKKSEEMFRKDVLWREENQVDGILDREDIPEDVLLNLPEAWCGTTNEGCPILLEILGRYEARKYIEKYGKNRIEEVHIIFMEKINRRLEMESERQGRKITQYVEIMDMAGYSYKQLASKIYRESMVEGTKTMEMHYPEILRQCVIVDAPKIFAMLFTLLKPFIPKCTLEKLDIYGPDKEKWRQAIREKFPVENIPTYWGGTLQGKDEFCSGSDIWFQGLPDLRPYMNGLAESDTEYSVTTVNARDRFTKEFHVSVKNSIVEWKFKTENNDIGFEVRFFIADDINGKKQDVFPYSRVDAQNSVQEGSYICHSPGKIQFVFDNSFSYVKSKTLLYKISVDEPISEIECSEL